MGLDGVELVLAIEDTFNIAIPDEEAADLITPALVISYVQRAVASGPERKSCLSQRAFHRVRAQLRRVTGASRGEITLDTKIRKLFPKETRQERWEDFRDASGLEKLPKLTLGHGLVFDPTRVRDLVRRQTFAMAAELNESASWTDEEVRVVVRQVISEQLGIEKFCDEDEFVRDLGVD